MTARRFLGEGRNTTWLEPACGSGRYLRVAAGRGKRVIGIDRNAAMIEYARHRLGRHARRGLLVEGDMSRFVLPRDVRADFAFCLINTVRHLESDAAMLNHLESVAAALRPRGVYALGVSLTCYGRDIASEDVWVGQRGRCRVHQLVQFTPPTARGRRERVITHLTVTTPGHEEHIDSTYWLRSYSGPQWAELLAASAMEPIAAVDERGRDHPWEAMKLTGDEHPGLRGWDAPEASGYAIYMLARRADRTSGATTARRVGRKFPHAARATSR